MGEPRTGRDEESVRRFVEHAAMVYAELGFPRMPARVLMLLMCAEEDALTAAELAERLGVSPAAISGAVRYLTQIGLVVREPVPGSRRDRYRVADTAWYLASHTKRGSLKTIADLTDEGIAALGGEATHAGARLADMRDFYRFLAEEFIAIGERWEAIRASRRSQSDPPP